MSTLKKTISIDENVANQASTISSNFSAVVEAALIEYIQHHRAQKAIKSFGKWDTRKESSADIVDNLRRQDDRTYSMRNDSAEKKRTKSKRKE